MISFSVRIYLKLASEVENDQSDSSAMSLEDKLMSGDVNRTFLVVRHFRLRLISYPIWRDAH